MTKPAWDFLKGSFTSKDGSASFHVHTNPEEHFLQIQYGGCSAKLLYTLTLGSSEPDLISIIESACQVAGEQEKIYLLANIPNNSDAFGILKSKGFRTYLSQSIWKVHGALTQDHKSNNWKFANSSDLISISQFLKKNSSPWLPSVQPWNFADTFQMVSYNRRGDLVGVATIRHFANRILLQPVFDQELTDPNLPILELLTDLSETFTDIFLLLPVNTPLNISELKEYAVLLEPQNQYMLRSLAVKNTVKGFNPAEAFNHEKGFPKPSTPFSNFKI